MKDESYERKVIKRNHKLPHIKGFELGLSKEHQIKNAKDVDSHTCFYPTDKALEKVKIDYQCPYTALMQNGKAQIDIIFLM